jgi:ZIP family zinc transporter/zinc and cadmium transporter
MNWQSYLGVALAAFAGLGNALGGWLVVRHFRTKPGLAMDAASPRGLNVLTQIGAGILLAITIMEFLPAAIQTIRPRAWAAPMILCGYMLVHLVEHAVVPLLQSSARAARGHGISTAAVLSAVVGLSVHSLFDGVAIGAAAHLSRLLGWLLFIAILSHKLPVGATVASIALTAGAEGHKALVAAALVGAASPIGAMLVYALAPSQTGIAFGIGAGVMLYVAASELIPAENATQDKAVPCRVLAGVVLFAITQYLLKKAGLE